jgi:electron-transferring-flavoprotein dehydrogenase
MTERSTMEADIVCVGFGPATGGFLTTLSRAMMNADGTPAIESRVSPGMPLQVLCYERADDIASGVSGVVTRGRAIKASFPDFDPSQIPMAAKVSDEKTMYLLDPLGASRRGWLQRIADFKVKMLSKLLGSKDHSFTLPYEPPFLNKHDGFVMSIGQFNQWVGSQLMGTGLVQIWPGSPVAEPLFEGDKVVGVRLADQGVDKSGNPEGAYMPGMDVKAALTVVGDGPVGPVGHKLDQKFGFPEGHHATEWAAGMKVVIDLPETCTLKPGTVIHTMGYPEPGIFGFLYVYPDRVAAAGIFTMSWFENPARTTYRYMQYWLQHPAIWKHVGGGAMRSWGAKSLQESGPIGEPYLVGDGYARIGESSGAINNLTNSGVDEAWATGCQLAEAVIELAKAGKEFTKTNLDATYVKRRRASWLEKEAKTSKNSRNGFRYGFVPGAFGMGLAGMTGGLLHFPGSRRNPSDQLTSLESYYAGCLGAEKVELIRKECLEKGINLHDAMMDAAGWPKIEFDGKLLVSQQDALLMGGKVQAAGGYADHVMVIDPAKCVACATKVCVGMCSGQALSMPEKQGPPAFDREKCVHCGVCLWNCTVTMDQAWNTGNVQFNAGAGGFHSAEN